MMQRVHVVVCVCVCGCASIWAQFSLPPRQSCQVTRTHCTLCRWHRNMRVLMCELLVWSRHSQLKSFRGRGRSCTTYQMSRHGPWWWVCPCSFSVCCYAQCMSLKAVLDWPDEVFHVPSPDLLQLFPTCIQMIPKIMARVGDIVADLTSGR